MVQIRVNGRTFDIAAPPDTPLLWVLREEVGLTGTKYACGIGACGACTVLFDDDAVRACTVPLAAAAGVAITTIEGLGGDHPLQRAWAELVVPQCGYCQPGQIMAAVALLRVDPAPDDAAITAALDGNLCRCGTYGRIHAAVRRATGNGA